MRDGPIIIDKPAGMTSHDVVYRLRKILKTRKIGHTGTLDPFATGVLVMLVGKATRLARFLHSDEKEYEAVLRFGFETETGDLTGERRASEDIRQQEDPEPYERPEQYDRLKPVLQVQIDQLSVELINSILPEFKGQIQQVPPMYSAKKVGGERLYKLARQGKEIERKPVMVTITGIECTGELDSTVGTRDFGLRVTCSAGTYIRTLAEDIGRRIGIGCHLSALRRIRAGRFTIDQAKSLEDLAELGPEEIETLPMRDAVSDLLSLELSTEEQEMVRHGRAFRPAEPVAETAAAVSLISTEGTLAAVGEWDPESGTVKPKLVMIN